MAVSTQLLIADYRKALALGETAKASSLFAEIRKRVPKFGVQTVNRQEVIAANYDAKQEVDPLPTVFYPVESGVF
jgi:hypothetical protein